MGVCSGFIWFLNWFFFFYVPITWLSFWIVKVAPITNFSKNVHYHFVDFDNASFYKKQ